MAWVGWRAAKVAVAAAPGASRYGNETMQHAFTGMTAKADMYRANAEMCRHVAHTATGRGDRAEWLDLADSWLMLLRGEELLGAIRPQRASGRPMRSDSDSDGSTEAA